MRSGQSLPYNSSSTAWAHLGWELLGHAELAGYQSETAFQRAFKQHMGFTPAEWRRGARAGQLNGQALLKMRDALLNSSGASQTVSVQKPPSSPKQGRPGKRQ